MTPNWIGVAAAFATFFSVWLGHVSVRAVEYRAASLTGPTIAYLALSAAAYLGSALSGNLLLSAALGIAGTTLWFDALELRRQFKRVIRGHAPANPQNPRHVPYLATGQATSINWLDRAPDGRLADREAA
jgi:predicted outer membrane lipoprotein